MDQIRQLLDLFLHLDKHLDVLIQGYGVWAYLVLFLIIFAETGLVVTPFLPGDSLLFAAGALAAGGSLDIKILFLLLTIAAIVGDSLNYQIGYFIGPKVFEKRNSKIFRPEYLERTQRFYEKYGGKAIVIARFVPIVRTFAPFLAGVGKMNYGRFISYNVAGALLWMSLLLFAGYLFGEQPIVKNNFGLVVVAIIFISILPAVYEVMKAKYEKRQAPEKA